MGRSSSGYVVEMLAAAGPQEGLDHLILLPDCVLSMDSAQLKRDLAGLQFRLHLLSDGPHGSVWLCEYKTLLSITLITPSGPTF